MSDIDKIDGLWNIRDDKILFNSMACLGGQCDKSKAVSFKAQV